MPGFACDKCGKYYSDKKSANKHKKCECGGNIVLIDHLNAKNAIGREPKRLAKLTSKEYIPLIMIFMMVMVGILIFVAASSVFDPAGFYDVKCPNCHSKEINLIDSDITNQSISLSFSLDVYLCKKCGKQFYYDKESEETIGI